MIHAPLPCIPAGTITEKIFRTRIIWKRIPKPECLPEIQYPEPGPSTCANQTDWYRSPAIRRIFFPGANRQKSGSRRKERIHCQSCPGPCRNRAYSGIFREQDSRAWTHYSMCVPGVRSRRIFLPGRENTRGVRHAPAPITAGSASRVSCIRDRIRRIRVHSPRIITGDPSSGQQRSQPRNPLPVQGMQVFRSARASICRDRTAGPHGSRRGFLVSVDIVLPWTRMNMDMPYPPGGIPGLHGGRSWYTGAFTCPGSV
jgi:hypothetical protein